MASNRRALALVAFVALALGTGSTAVAQSRRKPTPTPPPPKTPSDLTEGLGVAKSVPLPEVVATIDGAPIHREELERTLSGLLAANGRSAAQLSPEDRDKAYHSVLDEMIADRLIARQSNDEKIDDIETEKRFDAVKQAFPTEAAFNAELKKNGQTIDKVKNTIRSQLRQQQWTEGKVADQIAVTPEEAEKFYKGNPERFNLPEMVRASHILLAVRKDAPPEAVLEKETMANDLEARLKKGESFEDLARQYSDDPNAKQTGGDLDYFGRDRIMPEFAEAAFKLKSGEISAPVRTQFGFHIIKLTDHRAARTASLEESKPQITEFLKESKRQKAVSDLIASLRSAAKIEVFLP